MRLTILETGRPPAALSSDWPDYAEMMLTLLAPHIEDLSVDAIATLDSAPFPALRTVEAAIVTGSAHGVYEDTPWMEGLFDFIREAGAQKIPVIGICFGHQAVAKAFGAVVQKSDKGWGIGRHEYDVYAAPNWMDPLPSKQISLAVSHQDQVETLPAGAIAVAGSAFTPFAALDYPEQRAMSFQGHPEYSAAFANALYGVRKGTVLQTDLVEAAEQSLTAPTDRHLVGQWMANHLKS
ncbi:MAG: type 1 glutamine amidotransferase [Pseudomonadota bacterium]